MKKLITVSIAALIAAASISAFADGMESKSNSRNIKSLTQPPRTNSGYYVGAGLGWFDAAKAFKEDERDGEAFTYVKKKPGSSTPIVPNFLVGYRFNDYFSADVNAQYRTFKYDASRAHKEEGFDMTLIEKLKQGIKNYSLFLNGNLSVPNSTSVTPYITAGLGYAYNNAGELSIEDATELKSSSGKKTNNFAWNAGVGTKIKVSEKFDLDVNYKYLSLGKISTSDGVDKDGDVFSTISQNLKAHQVMLNLIYNL